MKSRAKSNTTDRVYATLTALLGSSAFLFFFMILIVLVIYAYPSVVVNGLSFFINGQWVVRTNNAPMTVDGFQMLQGSLYGASVFFIGTLATAAIAIVIGVPVSLGIAILLSQYAPKRIAS